MAHRGNNRNNAAFLDNVRHRLGNERLRDVFRDEAGRDNENALRLVNDDNVGFPSLFVLRPEIHKENQYDRLNERNRQAFDISDGILSGRLADARAGRECDRDALSWMLHTGCRAEGMNEHFDSVLDSAALMLAKVHGDRECLRPIVELIFGRHRRGQYTYDLIWAFFEVSEPQDLMLLAGKLRSHDPKDVELARELLNFVPCLETEQGPNRQYQCCARWIRQNRGRLYYTGQSNQQRSNPRRYALAGEAGGGGEVMS